MIGSTRDGACNAVDGNGDEDEGEGEKENERDFAAESLVEIPKPKRCNNYRLSGMLESAIIGMGKTTRMRSVKMSETPMVIS